jgi:nicotinate-nucleotide adenylyltransferase
VADRLGLDQVRFIPAGVQPFKGGHGAPGGDRAAMLDLAVAGDPRFVVDRRELERPGPSYMIDTLRALKAEFPQDQLFLLLGTDAARDLPAWREADVVPTLATVVVHVRGGAGVPKLPWPVERADVDAPDVTATAVRRAVAQGQAVRAMVPPGVAAYIATHRLYLTEDAC